MTERELQENVALLVDFTLGMYRRLQDVMKDAMVLASQDGRTIRVKCIDQSEDVGERLEELHSRYRHFLEK